MTFIAVICSTEYEDGVGLSKQRKSPSIGIKEELTHPMASECSLPKANHDICLHRDVLSANPLPQ